MRDHADELADANLVVFGVSFDSVSANRKFAEKYSFPFLLLSDEDRAVGMAYGAAKSKDAGYASRISYVIDPDGKVMLAYPKVDPGTHLDQIFMDLRLKG